MRGICGEPLALVGLPLGPLTELCRPSDVREFCRCGITNFGGGCGVYCGGMELTDVWRVNLFDGSSDFDGICTDSERFGNGGAFDPLDRGGMAGGGPRLVTELWD